MTRREEIKSYIDFIETFMKYRKELDSCKDIDELTRKLVDEINEYEFRKGTFHIQFLVEKFLKEADLLLKTDNYSEKEDALSIIGRTLDRLESYQKALLFIFENCRYH